MIILNQDEVSQDDRQRTFFQIIYSQIRMSITLVAKSPYVII